MHTTVRNADLIFENLWKKDVSHVRDQVLSVWYHHGGPGGKLAENRLSELVFVVRGRSGEVAGISTAFKAYVKQLRNHFYILRLMLTPAFRVPGLTSKLLVSTRDFLESIHEEETTDQPIGVLTLVENDRIRRFRNEAIWPASKMVYIGNSKEGHHLRVYYFKGARIAPQ